MRICHSTILTSRASAAMPIPSLWTMNIPAGRLSFEPSCRRASALASRADVDALCVPLEYLRAAVAKNEQRVVGVALVAHFHSRRADRHARHREAKRVRALGQQPLYITGRHVTFDEVAVDERCVARTQFRCDACPGFHRPEGFL